MKKCFFLFFLMLSCSTASLAQSLMGDVNGDNKVDFKDVSELSNFIMGKPSANFDETKADINGDTKINAADLVRVINMAMVTLYDSYSLVVWKSDGTKDYYNISELPETTFGDAIHVVKTSGGETKAYDKEEVLRYSFSLKDNPNDPKPEQNQNAREAFYVYQNDGHFEGFFYDEVQKIAFSEVDTFGIAHDGIVSQEIVTADSTYRFMLTAIDSIGFVQPDVIFNPRLHMLDRSIWNGTCLYYYSDESSDYSMVQFKYDADACILTFDEMYVYPENWPQINDVFVYTGVNDNDVLNGWGIKVERVEEKDTYVYAYCKPIDDIGDVFQQFVCVERYGYTPDGYLESRRVAGWPDLTVGNASKTRASSGTWEGDLFNFSINSHIPLYDNNDLVISINPSIEGKLNVKAVWNLSLFGDKYIGITSQLNFGVGCGFSVDGKIKDFFPSGIGGLLGGVPVPATCPLIYLNIAPDAFIRGEAHVNLNVSSPRLNGAMWSKLEINNWVPSMSIGFGNADNSKFEYADKSSAGATLSLSGFVQTGMLFPMTFKSLPLIQKIFDSEIGGQWFVGPKLAGNISLDLTTNPLSEVATYNLLKNTKLSFHMLDADYEVKAKIKTLFSGTKEVTLADGSFNIFPPLDAALAPDFSDCSDTYEERTCNNSLLYGQNIPCRVFTFTPQGAVLMPTYIGTRLYKVNGDGTEEWISTQVNQVPYYHIHQMMGQPIPKNMCAEYVLWYDSMLMPSEVQNGGKFRVRPFVRGVWGEVAAAPDYEFEEGTVALLSSNELIADYDGSCDKPIQVTGNCTDIEVAAEGHYDYENFKLPYVKVVNKGEGKFEICVDKKLFNETFGKNYSMTDTIKIEYQLKGTKGDNLFTPTVQNFMVIILPNKDELPLADFSIKDDGYNYNTPYIMNGLFELTQLSITKSDGDANRWRCVAKNENTAPKEGEYGNSTLSFDLIIETGYNPYAFSPKIPIYGFRLENISYTLVHHSHSSFHGTTTTVTCKGSCEEGNSFEFDPVSGEIGTATASFDTTETYSTGGTLSSSHSIFIILHFKDNFKKM